MTGERAGTTRRLLHGGFRYPAALAVSGLALLLGAAACSGDGSASPAEAGGSSAVASANGPAAPATRPLPGSSGADRVIATGLASPWGLAFLPSGDAVIGERDTGRLLLLPTKDGNPAHGYGSPVAVGTVPGVHHSGEGGLLGLAVSPGYATDHLVYAYLTTSSDNRIIRFPLTGQGTRWSLGAATPVLTGLAAGAFHDGGRIAFGPDGMLYAGVGDATVPSRAQDRASLNGKILRMRPDGSVPPDNPLRGSLVYSYGHRNVQGLAWDSAGRLWATEFGQNTWDEINLIRPGRNYGWPVVEGVGNDERYTDPVVTWPTGDASPSGAAIVNDTLFAGALRGERIWSIDLRPSLGATPATAVRVGTPEPLRRGTYGRLRTVVAAPDGSVWVTTSNTDSRGRPAADDDRIIALG